MNKIWSWSSAVLEYWDDTHMMHEEVHGLAERRVTLAKK